MKDAAVVKLIEEFKVALLEEHDPEYPITDKEMESGLDSIEWSLDKMEDLEKMFGAYRNDPSNTNVDLLLSVFFYQLNKDREMNKSLNKSKREKHREAIVQQLHHTVDVINTAIEQDTKGHVPKHSNTDPDFLFRQLGYVLGDTLAKLNNFIDQQV